MPKYVADKIEEAYLLGVYSRIKYLKSYTKIDFIDWLHNMLNENYKIEWKTKHSIIMRDKDIKSDAVIITCKQEIKNSWIKEYYNPIAKRHTRTEPKISFCIDKQSDSLPRLLQYRVMRYC